MIVDEGRIPRIIHYCWFGKGEKPDIVKKCMDSWKRNLSQYEIIEWNEDSFDINCNEYVKKAYEAKKYAFVSDYVRVYALHTFGGIYLDTDVEVFKPFDDLLHHESFWGFEQGDYIATSTIGAAKGNQLIGEFIKSYKGKQFVSENVGKGDLTNVGVVTEMVKNLGLVLDGTCQELEGIGAFYPQTYFSPYDYINCRKLITDDTYTMHHFYKSWLPLQVRIKTKAKIILVKIIGSDNLMKMRELLLK